VKQSRLASWIETLTNTFAGFGLSLLLQYLYFDVWLGFPLHIADNFAFAVIMTVVSLARGFTMRRIFEALHIRRPLSPFMQAVVAERFRQVEQEGYDASHDLGHSPAELASAAAAYLVDPDRGSPLWPWLDGYKPDHQDKRRNYVRGAALALAAGELNDKLRKLKVSRTHPPGGEKFGVSPGGA
jgi:hypothetical protein